MTAITKLGPGGYPVAVIAATPPPVATPQGWMSQSPIILAKKFGVHLQQATSFEPQGPIYSITPQGWNSDSPQVRAKPYPAGLQMFASPESPQPLVPTPLLGFSESVIILKKPVNVAQQQVSSFTPQGPIYSITPQGWASESPQIRVRPYPAFEQQFFAFGPAGAIYSVTPQGWASQHPVLTVKPYPSWLQHFSGFEPAGQINSVTPQGWASASPIVLTKTFPAFEQLFSSPDEPEPPFTNPLGFTSDVVMPRRKPFVDVQATSFAPFALVKISVSFTASPAILARSSVSFEQQQTGFETPTAPKFKGYVTEAQPVKVRYVLDYQVTSFVPYPPAVAVATIYWTQAQSTDVLSKKFPAFEQQFLAYSNFWPKRIFFGPPLSGRDTTPGLSGVDEQAALIAKNTTPGLQGVDAQASLEARKSNSSLVGSVDVDNSPTLPLPVIDNVRVTVDGETRVTFDGETRVVGA